MVETALEDVTVIDLTYDIAGPYCTKMLADFGANVIKVEELLCGDKARRMGPFPRDIPHPEKSGLFLFHNTNKWGITLNIGTKTGGEILKALVADADILVENFPPGRMAGLGLGYERLRAINPGLVMTSISSFGQTGDYRDYKATDVVEYALGGFMFLSGDPDREPLQVTLCQAQYMAARNAVLATLVALFYQRATGEGQYVDVSTMESVTSQPPFYINQYTYTGAIASRGPKYEDVVDGAYLACRDGYVTLTTGGGQPFGEFADFLGLPELKDPKFANRIQRALNSDELAALVEPKLKEWNKHEFFHSGMKHGFVFGVAQSPEDIVNCPQLAAREYFQEVEHPEAGRLEYPGACFDMRETPFQIRRPAPLLGQHNEEVFCRLLGYSRQELVKLREMGVI